MAKRQDDWRDLDWSLFARGEGETFRGTSGDDRLVGTDFSDIFRIQQGGDDRVNAGKKADVIYIGASLTADDRINGGKVYDTLILEGDYSGGLTLDTDTISRIEELNLQGNFNYSITLAPDMRHDKSYLQVFATEAQSLYLDGSAMDFSLFAYGSSGDDVMIGGSGGNGFVPGGGRDVLTGGSERDTFNFRSTTDSLPSDSDVITDFDGDRIYMAEIDGDTQTPGVQNLHFGATPGRTGDVTVNYDSGQDVTFVSVFTDGDADPEMVIQLLGDHSDLTSADFVF